MKELRVLCAGLVAKGPEGSLLVYVCVFLFEGILTPPPLFRFGLIKIKHLSTFKLFFQMHLFRRTKNVAFVELRASGSMSHSL